MRRPDAAGGENIGKPRAALVDGGDNGGFDIGNHAGFHQPYPALIQLFCQPRQVLILRPAGEDFIADYY